MTVEDFATRGFKQIILKKHNECAEWLHTLPLPLEPYGYEWLYRDDPERFKAIKNSDDYFTRYRPDYLTEIGGAPWLLELKSSFGWLQALSLAFNANVVPGLSYKRPYPTVYFIAQSLAVTAEDLVKHHVFYFKHLMFWEKKQKHKSGLSDRWVNEIRCVFDEIPAEISKDDVGWHNDVFLRSGDPAVEFKGGAPLESVDNFLKRITSNHQNFRR